MIDRQKLARLEAVADAANAALRSMSDSYRERLSHANRLRADALARAQAFENLSLGALNDIDPAELQAAGIDTASLREANIEMAGAREIKARMDAESASAQCMAALVTNLRRYANDNFSFGD